MRFGSASEPASHQDLELHREQPGPRQELRMGHLHTAESIHQEPVCASSPKRVYEALTDVQALAGALTAVIATMT